MDKMRRWIVLGILIFTCFASGVPEYLFPGEQSAVTTLFLVRHAEKAQDGSADPPLTPAGTARAEELAYMLGHIELDAIYSTPYVRTRQTVLLTAENKDLEVKLYAPGEKDFLKKILETYSGGIVLIAGHSNTIPALANELAGGPLFDDLDESVYDNLFIAIVPIDGKPLIHRMRFGARTPEQD